MVKTRKRTRRGKQSHKMSGGAEYTKDVSEPWFSLIKLGLKTVEGRLGKGDFKAMNVGDQIIFTNEELPFKRTHRVTITQINEYPTFREYLTSEGLQVCLPGIDTIDEGVEVYYKYYKAQEGQYPVRAIHMTVSQ